MDKYIVPLKDYIEYFNRRNVVSREEYMEYLEKRESQKKSQ